jgi:hypothetical protein
MKFELTQEDVANYNAIGVAAKILVETINKHVPEGYQRSSAVESIGTAMHYAVRGIFNQEDEDPFDGIQE